MNAQTMREKFEQREKNLPKYFIVAIIMSILFVALMVVLATTGEDGIPVVMPFFMCVTGCLIASWVVYGVKSGRTSCSKKLMEVGGLTIEECFDGVDELHILPKSKVYTGMNALVVGSGVVIPYNTILWLYKKVTKDALSSRVLETEIIINTTNDMSFSEKLNEEELMWFIEKYIDRFAPNFMLGYDAERKRAYEKMVRK